MGKITDRRLKKLEQKVETLSKDIGIQYWIEEEEKDSGSPPTFCHKANKIQVPQYKNLSPRIAMELLLEHLNIEIKKSSEIYPLYMIVKKKLNSSKDKK